MPSDTPLWDPNTFNLDKSWPRSSIADQVFPFSRQPLRFLYESYFYVTLPLRLFFILIPTTIYRQTLDKNNPPNRKWVDTLSIMIGRTLIDSLWVPTGGGMRGVFLKPSSDKERLKLLKSTKALPEVIHPTLQVKDLRQPVQSWAENANVKQSDDLTIWWLGRRNQMLKQEKAQEGEKIMMYLSGGGYLVGTCYPSHDLAGFGMAALDQIRSQSDKLSKDVLPQTIVSVEYRRTTTTATPGALIDALSLYYHLINNLQFEAKNISISGDSAGGHLVNMLVRYLVEGGEPTPGKIILISPWGDQAGTIIEHDHSSFKRYLTYDFLSDHFYHHCKDIYAQQFSNPTEALLDVYFSPCAILGKVKTRKSKQKGGEEEEEEELITKETEKEIFRAWPPTLVTCGNYEILKDQSTEMVKRLKLAKEAEGKIGKQHLDFFTMETCHDPSALPPFAFTQARKEGMQKIVDWLALEM